MAPSMDAGHATAMFGTVAGLSFVGNTILCIVIIRKRSMLSKTYNILILNLAICDALTGIFLVATPNYVIPLQSFPVMDGLSGRVFCRVIFSTYCLFVCGKASNTTIMCLSIERWYAVVKPAKYKANFGRRRVALYIAMIWLVALVTEVFGFFIADLQLDGRCDWITPFYGERLGNAFLVLHIIVTFYIPMTVTWVSFAHIWHRMSRNQASNERSVTAKKNVARMCMLAALLLTVLWFPTETFWVLKKYKVVELPSVCYWVFNFLAFFNSCCNPPLYCLTNKTYRREVLALFSCRGNAQVAPDESTQTQASETAGHALQVLPDSKSKRSTYYEATDQIELHNGDDA